MKVCLTNSIPHKILTIVYFYDDENGKKLDHYKSTKCMMYAKQWLIATTCYLNACTFEKKT